MTDPEPVVDEQTAAPDPEAEAAADTIKRQWNDALWYSGGAPYRGRP